MRKKTKTKARSRRGLLKYAAILVVGLAVFGLRSEVAHNSTQASAYAQSKPITVEQTRFSKGQLIQNSADNTAKTTKAQSNKAVASPAVIAATIQAKAGTPATTVVAAPSFNNSMKLYANPNSNVSINAQAYASANPSDAAVMEQLASTPMAEWFGDFSGDITTAVNTYVSAAANAQELPVLVAYNIPQRDCGGYSAGGASSASAYQAWISQFAAAIGNRSATVILEPDALADMDCLSSSDQQVREQLLGYAVQALRADPNVSIYLDAGNSNWQPASVMATRLNAADIAQATGFSVNVSNFYTTASSASYGESLSALVGNKHFVIDTSRNGNGSDANQDWCNPDGAAFGQTPTLQTGSGLIDAYLWIKNPGESDGPCGVSQAGTMPPAAGVWWPQYVLMLANNSAGW